MKLLIVDDEPEILEGMKCFFESQGAEVFTTQWGQEALALVKTCCPQVMMLDIKLQGMNGVEILRRAKEIAPEVAIIMLTGLNDEGLETECLALGASYFLQKPVRVEDLGQLVHSLC